MQKKGNEPWNKGLTKETSEIIKQHSDFMKEFHKNNKVNLGNHYSDDTKKKISEKMKLWFSDPDNKEKFIKSNRNKHHTEETKRKLSEIRKKWLSEHKDHHPWKDKDHFKSKPCENLKLYLHSKGINFVEEYEPFDDYNYSLDIAWPDEMLAIEVNGNQHYNSDGTLKPYYQKRHDIFESRGWTIFEIHYSKCYNINVKDFEDILNLSIYDKDYVGKYLSKRDKKLKEKEEKKKKAQEEKQKKQLEREAIIDDLINNSGIDFSISGWSSKAKNYLEERGNLFDSIIIRAIKKIKPEFLSQDWVWKRKGTIIV